MKHIKKLMCAAISAVMLIVLMCGCGNQADTEETENSEYDYLKTEIVGIWMEEGGSVLTEDQIFGYSYPFFEFTSNNEVYNHYVILDDNNKFADASSKSGTYRLDGNLLVYVEDNVGAYIDIKDGVMTMTTDSGEKKYERLTVSQVIEGSLYYKDEELRKQQDDVQAELDRQAYESAQAAQSEESAAETETSETEASETETSAGSDGDASEAAESETSEAEASSEE